MITIALYVYCLFQSRLNRPLKLISNALLSFFRLITLFRSALFTHAFIFLLACCVRWDLAVTRNPDPSLTLLIMPKYALSNHGQMLASYPGRSLDVTFANLGSFNLLPQHLEMIGPLQMCSSRDITH